MTVILMIVTLLVFLTADHFVQRSRRARVFADANASSGQRLPEGVALAANHTWVRKDPLGVVTIGIDELVGKIIGSIDTILLPDVDSLVVPALASVHVGRGNRRIAVSVPMSGRVVEINKRVLKRPALLQTEPYDSGWLVKIRPSATQTHTPEYFSGTRAAGWLNKQAGLMREFFSMSGSPGRLVTMQDGGVPAAGALEQCDISVWRRFEQTFVSLSPVDGTRQIPKEMAPC